MPNTKKNRKKYNMILDTLQQILKEKKIQNISVSEIAQKAGIGKGSIYYYFASKDEILDALIKRSYEQPLLAAKNLTTQTDISPFTRMALLFQAYQKSSIAFIRQRNISPDTIACAQDLTYFHQKHLTHIITELKPALTEIINQGIETGEIHFEYPSALAEIVLIVITIKLDNYLLPSNPAEIVETLQGLIILLEKGTEVASEMLDFFPYLFHTAFIPDEKKLHSNQEWIDELRKKYVKNPPEGMTAKLVRGMTDSDLLDMHGFFYKNNNLQTNELL